MSHCHAVRETRRTERRIAKRCRRYERHLMCVCNALPLLANLKATPDGRYISHPPLLSAESVFPDSDPRLLWERLGRRSNTGWLEMLKSSGYDASTPRIYVTPAQIEMIRKVFPEWGSPAPGFSISGAGLQVIPVRTPVGQAVLDALNNGKKAAP